MEPNQEHERESDRIARRAHEAERELMEMFKSDTRGLVHHGLTGLDLRHPVRAMKRIMADVPSVKVD